MTEKKVDSKKKETASEKIERLENRISNLESAISKFATLSGHGNFLHDFGIERWHPSREERMKNRG